MTDSGAVLPDDEAENFEEFLNSIQGFTYEGNGIDPTELLPTSDEDETPTDEVTDERVTDPPPVTPTSTVRIGDEDIDAEKARILYELGKTLRENGLADRVAPTPPTLTPEPSQVPPVLAVDPSQGASPPAPPVEPVTPPSFIDPDDEVQMGLWNKIQSIEAAQARQEAITRQAAQTQLQAQRASEFSSALSAYRTKYPSITDEDLALIRPAAALIVDPLVATLGPVPGMEKAMYLASLDIESTRNKILTPNTPTNKEVSSTRKRKLNALNGSSGSTAPKSTARPQLSTDKDMVNAMARELADNLSTNGRIN